MKKRVSNKPRAFLFARNREVKNEMQDTDIGDYICIGGKKIPIRHNTFPFSPALCKAIGIDEDALQAVYPDISIIYTPLSVRAAGALVRGGINTVADVNASTDKELLAIRNFGKSCLDEVLRLFPDRVRVREEKKERRIRNPERLAEMLQMRREGQTIREIARQYYISPQRVQQILQQAVAMKEGETHIKGI